MNRTRFRIDSEVIDKVREDEKVWNAVEELIESIFNECRINGAAQHLIDVIDNQLGVIAGEEIEEEGLDGRYCESGVA